MLMELSWRSRGSNPLTSKYLIKSNLRKIDRRLTTLALNKFAQISQCLRVCFCCMTYQNLSVCFILAVAEADPQRGNGSRSVPLKNPKLRNHLAADQNQNALADIRGHTISSLIFSHYRNLVMPEEGKRYFAIRPPAPADNVISMASVPGDCSIVYRDGGFPERCLWRRFMLSLRNLES